MPTADRFLRHHKKLLLSAVMFLVYHDTLLARIVAFAILTQDLVWDAHCRPSKATSLSPAHHEYKSLMRTLDSGSGGCESKDLATADEVYGLPSGFEGKQSSPQVVSSQLITPPGDF